MSHTPVIWTANMNTEHDVDGVLIESEEYGHIATVNCPEETLLEGEDYRTYTYPDVMHAHARLIAATPELLAALKALVLEVELKDNPSDEGASSDCDQMDAARAAISKAEGKP